MTGYRDLVQMLKYSLFFVCISYISFLLCSQELTPSLC